tara:strand:+ start:163 stop:858 length:696 start_codon:yes stop_codon:yes gene_type:complete
MIKIFQIYYHENQQKDLLDGFTPYKNNKKNIFVENQCISDIRHDKLTSDVSHVGLVSHKFHDKVLHKPEYIDLCKTIEENLNADIFSPRLQGLWWSPIREPRPIYFPNQLNMKDLAMPLLNDMADLNIIKKTTIGLWQKNYKTPIYCNFWVAKKEVFINYVDSFLSKVFELIESYEKDNWIFTLNRSYAHPPPEEWQKSAGFEHYPAITFILERLVNIYLQDRNLNHQAIL